MEIIEQLKKKVDEYQIASISIATLSLILLLLRRFHGKFVVYPGKRYHRQMLEAGTIIKTPTVIAILDKRC
jgi:hypothetical protein